MTLYPTAEEAEEASWQAKERKKEKRLKHQLKKEIVGRTPQSRFVHYLHCNVCGIFMGVVISNKLIKPIAICSKCEI
jgi:hypothetical protein